MNSIDKVLKQIAVDEGDSTCRFDCLYGTATINPNLRKPQAKQSDLIRAIGVKFRRFRKQTLSDIRMERVVGRWEPLVKHTVISDNFIYIVDERDDGGIDISAMLNDLSKTIGDFTFTDFSTKYTGGRKK